MLQFEAEGPTAAALSSCCSVAQATILPLARLGKKAAILLVASQATLIVPAMLWFLSLCNSVYV